MACNWLPAVPGVMIIGGRAEKDAAVVVKERLKRTKKKIENIMLVMSATNNYSYTLTTVALIV